MSLTSAAAGRDDPLDVSLRPTGFSEFVGQAQARANLEVFIAAAKQRKQALDHVLFVGPPGLGKTTLALVKELPHSLFDQFIATLIPAVGELLLDLLFQISWQRDLHGWSPRFILRFRDARNCGGSAPREFPSVPAHASADF